MGLLAGMLIGAGVALAGKLCSTGKEMYRDNLISQKELEEINAKSKAFERFIEYHKQQINLAYDLEVKFLDHLNEIIDKSYKTLDKIIDKVDALDDNSPKIHFYINTMTEFQQNISKIVSVLNNNGKYYNNNMLETTRVQMIDYHSETDIGTRDTSEKESNLLNFSEFPELPKLPRKN